MSRSVYSLGILTLVMGLALSLVAFYFFRYLESQKIAVDFERTARSFGFKLQGEIEKRISHLESIASLYAASKEVEREEFSQFVKPFLDRDRTIQALEWIQRVPADQRAHYELAARNDGFTGFQFTELHKSGGIIRAGLRNEYFPAYFLEPYEENKIALGFDSASDPERLEAMNRSRDLGRAVASGPVKLLQDSGNQKGLLIFWPIQRNKTPSDTLDSRRENLMGFAVGVFRIGDLMTGVLKDSPLPDQDLYFLDETEPGQVQFLFHRVSNLDSGSDDFDPNKILNLSDSQFGYHMDFDIGERKWKLLFNPRPSYIAKHRTWQPWFVLLGGIIFTGIALMYMTERMQVERTLAEQAIRDPLTNLYNRRYFNQRIHEAVSQADRHQLSLAVLLCDLDHFKTINDSRGHEVGDEVLKMVSKSVQEATRGTDLVFRWGGDEIVVVLPDVKREGVLKAADRVRRGVGSISQQVGVKLDLSIGAALYPEHGKDADELIRLADRALYIAKRGGDKIHIGEEEYHLDEHSIKVVFQPIVDVQSHSEVIGYEALSRDPQGKVSILELFKKYQAIGQLNELKCLCYKLQLKAAREVGLKKVFINTDFNVLSQLPLEPKPQDMEVILEISEVEALRDIENHLKITREWREKGYQFAIDDFGAGFISLPFIAQLIPDYIKIDRSSILKAVNSAKFMKFTKDLVQALRNYSKEGIIAEGIETEKELTVVKDMGIHLVQGFLLGKPQELNR